jgi:hypothetical protein
MWNFERKYSLIAAVSAVLILGVASGCKGFFVNQPTSITVSPSAQSFSTGQTQAFSALAAFSDNTSKNVTASATWTTSNSCIIAVIGTGPNAGNATAVGTGGSATITAAYNGVSGTATATAPTGLVINPCPTKVVSNYPQVVFTVGQGNVTFTAVGAGSAVTWTSSDTNVVSLSSNGLANFVGSGPATVTATTSSQSGSLAIVVQ